MSLLPSEGHPSAQVTFPTPFRAAVQGGISVLVVSLSLNGKYPFLSSNWWCIALGLIHQARHVAGPMLWAVVSTPVLKVMRKEGHGTYFKACITGSEIRFVGYSFVDDTDLIQTAWSQTDTATDVVHAMQNALNMWEGAIRATGGAIVPSKSFWYLGDFQWREGQWSYKDTEDAPASQHHSTRFGRTNCHARKAPTDRSSMNSRSQTCTRRQQYR